ncbi:hypothetical protein BN1708_010317 [Verticillium longisporum]|uniref:Uncharacterized protein n=1 Tax=Verticillium longisporum TaxID=100787 RepID=A0A0G4KQS6_VERLO|nr:hypothetical protein BN1708_010317 [Verticillium longisporum]
MATITELDAHEQPSEEMRASWKSYSKLEAFHLRNHPDIDDPRSEAQAKDYKVAGVIAAEKVASAFASVHPEPIDPSTIRDVPILYHPLLPGLLIVPDLVPPAVQKSLISLMVHRDLSVRHHMTNMHPFYEVPYRQDTDEDRDTLVLGLEANLLEGYYATSIEEIASLVDDTVGACAAGQQGAE